MLTIDEVNEVDARCDGRVLTFLKHLESRAKELCPDYPWKKDDTFEHLWAITCEAEGTELARLDWVKRCEELEAVLRETASALGAGGYNSALVEPDVYRQKINTGLEMLIRPLVERAEKAETDLRDLKDFLEGIRDQARERTPEGCTILDFLAVWNEQYQKSNLELRDELTRLKSILREVFKLLGSSEWGGYSAPGYRTLDTTELYKVMGMVAEVLEENE